MFYRLTSRWNKTRFAWLTRDILKSPPIRIVPAKWTIISMVSNSDVQMYLLSMKSFYTRIKQGKLVVIADRDMPQNLPDLLKQHFIGIEFAILEDIDTGRCQRGGTWERLVYLLRRAEHEYAIQVDCDTLAFGAELDEIVDCAESNRAFTLSNAGQPIRSMQEYAKDAQALQSRYIGIHAERLFDQYPNSDRMRYVRASSGLAGFSNWRTFGRAARGIPRRDAQAHGRRRLAQVGLRTMRLELRRGQFAQFRRLALPEIREFFPRP
jgi:hypothetical protein